MTPPDNSAEARAFDVAWKLTCAAFGRLQHPDQREYSNAHMAADIARAMLTFSAEQNTGGMPGRDREATSLRGRVDYLMSVINSTGNALGFDLLGKCPICGGVEGCSHTLRERINAAILAGTGRTGAEGWRDIASAPHSQEVVVRAGGMTFHARLCLGASVDENERTCDQWQATREGEHPPCWSDGCCWATNEDEVMSLQPEAWRPTTPTGDSSRG